MEPDKKFSTPQEEIAYWRKLAEDYKTAYDNFFCPFEKMKHI